MKVQSFSHWISLGLFCSAVLIGFILIILRMFAIGSSLADVSARVCDAIDLLSEANAEQARRIAVEIAAVQQEGREDRGRLREGQDDIRRALGASSLRDREISSRMDALDELNRRFLSDIRTESEELHARSRSQIWTDDPLRQEAFRLYDAGELSQALALFEELGGSSSSDRRVGLYSLSVRLKLHPSDSSLYSEIQNFLNQGNGISSANMDDRVIELELAARLAMELGEWQTAITSFEQLCRISPEAAQWPYFLGVCQLCSGDWTSAVESYDLSLQIDPFNAEAWADVADAAFQLGDFERCLASAQQGLSYFPSNQRLARALRLVNRSLADGQSEQDSQDSSATGVGGADIPVRGGSL